MQRSITPSAFDGGFGPDEEQWVKTIQADVIEWCVVVARDEHITKTEFLLKLSLKFNELKPEPHEGA